MWGGSSFGYTQWCIADQIDPGPSAYMIQIASSHFYDAFYHGNAFALETALYWANRSRRDRDKIPNSRTLDRGVNGFPLIEADDRAEEDVPFFNHWALHVERDAYWKEIDGADRLRDLRAPVHLMAGWYDPFLPAQLDDFIRIRRDGDERAAKGTRLVIGPWAHADSVILPGGFKGTPYRSAILEPMIDWFDTHLAGVSNAALAMPPVKLFVMGTNEWRDEQEWPLARAKETSYYLRSNGHANTAVGDGALWLEPPQSSEPPDAYTYDPRDPVPIAGGAVLGARAGVVKQNDIERRHDVLVYTTPTLTRDTEVTGPVQLILYVTTTAPNTDFTAKLVDVHPNGDAYNVCDGILRRAYTQTDEITEIAIDLWPTSMVFFEGHSIRLEVSSSSFPRFDRNPNTGRFIPTETEPIPAHQEVHHGATKPSRLILPLIPVE
jgi:putative CocE/NonD family hydrolase